MFDIQIMDGGIVKLFGRLDASQAERAKTALQAMKQSTTVDFSELDYVSSAGLGVIIETYKRLRDSGYDLRLVHMRPRIRTVFLYSGLDKVLHIE